MSHSIITHDSVGYIIAKLALKHGVCTRASVFIELIYMSTVRAVQESSVLVERKHAITVLF